jgi:hypothetical protein
MRGSSPWLMPITTRLEPFKRCARCSTGNGRMDCFPISSSTRWSSITLPDLNSGKRNVLSMLQEMYTPRGSSSPPSTPPQSGILLVMTRIGREPARFLKKCSLSSLPGMLTFTGNGIQKGRAWCISAIPDEAGLSQSSISFGTLKLAQALGDYQALSNANRRVIRFHLEGDVQIGLGRINTSLPDQVFV